MVRELPLPRQLLGRPGVRAGQGTAVGFVGAGPYGAARRVVLESEYIALGLVNLIATYRPQRIILSGGVMHEVGLMQGVHQRTRDLLDERYFPEARHIEDVVVAPALGDAAGVVGAILLAAQLRPGYLRPRPVGRLVTHIAEALAST